MKQSDWEGAVGDRLNEEIKAIYKGGFPESAEELEELAMRFGLTVRYHFGLPLRASEIQENVLHMALPTGRSFYQWRDAFQHENDEAGLIWEGTEPYNVPATDMKSARHRVAKRAAQLRC